MAPLVPAYTPVVVCNKGVFAGNFKVEEYTHEDVDLCEQDPSDGVYDFTLKVVMNLNETLKPFTRLLGDPERKYTGELQAWRNLNDVLSTGRLGNKQVADFTLHEGKNYSDTVGRPVANQVEFWTRMLTKCIISPDSNVDHQIIDEDLVKRRVCQATNIGTFDSRIDPVTVLPWDIAAYNGSEARLKNDLTNMMNDSLGSVFTSWSDATGVISHVTPIVVKSGQLNIDPNKTYFPAIAEFLTTRYSWSRVLLSNPDDGNTVLRFMEDDGIGLRVSLSAGNRSKGFILITHCDAAVPERPPLSDCRNTSDEMRLADNRRA
jgi:hypothetical protein